VPMHKGCTRDAQGTSAPPVQDSPRSGDGDVVAQASPPAWEPGVPRRAVIRDLPAAEVRAAASGEVRRLASAPAPQDPSERIVPAAPRSVATRKSLLSTGPRDSLIEEWSILSRGWGACPRERATAWRNLNLRLLCLHRPERPAAQQSKPTASHSLCPSHAGVLSVAAPSAFWR
jgi:hypothetical protein